MKDFLKRLPEVCQNIQIKERHRVALEHFFLADGTVWVILLTLMPYDRPKAWRMPRQEYWKIQPKHGTRDRWIRENLEPIIVGEVNQPRQKSLF